jgi:LysR family hydrogen peroxide-inducible transcriptional activator
VVRILKEVEELKRELGDVRGLRGGTVKLGVLPTIGPYFLPGIVSRFSESFPALQVSIVEDNTVNLLGMIESCELDLAVMSLPLSVEGIEKEHLFKEELLLALPSKHPLAAKEKVSVADLEKEKLILMKEEAQSLRDQLQASSNQCGVPPNVVLRSSQIETIEAHIVAGLGLSLLPKAAKLNAKNGIVYRSLEEPKPTRTNVVVWRKGRQHTKAAGEFLKHLRRALQETRDANPD